MTQPFLLPIGLVLLTILGAGCSAQAAPSPSVTVAPTALPTALPTATETPDPTQTPTLDFSAVTTFTPAPGWKTYGNEYLGYQFSYPPNATIEEQGFTGMLNDEPVPAGMAFDEYFDYLNRTLPGNLCVIVNVPGGAIAIRPPDEPLGRFTQPCPGMGIGEVRLEPAVETFDVGGRSYPAEGDKMFDEDTGDFEGEFYFITVDGGFAITYNRTGGPDENSSLEETLRQILATFQRIAPQPAAVPTLTCAGTYTHLSIGRHALVSAGGQGPNRVRALPDLSAEVVAQLYSGIIMRVLEGPVCADGLVFWRVENASIPGGTGWTAEGDGTEYYLEPYKP